MRRPAVVAALATLTLLLPTPAYAFAHDRAPNPYLHAALDVLTLAVVTAPLWTAYLWGRRPLGGLLALVGLVQLPVGIAGFVPIADPSLHAAALAGALLLTVGSLLLVRQSALTPRADHAPSR